MKRSDEYLFLLAAQREFEWLCKKIIMFADTPTAINHYQPTT